MFIQIENEGLKIAIIYPPSSILAILSARFACAFVRATPKNDWNDLNDWNVWNFLLLLQSPTFPER